MRSTRLTTGHLSKNSAVDTWTDVCSLRCIFSSFLANSSASLGRTYFYFIQSNGWKRNERIMGGGLTIHNNQPHGQMHSWHRGGDFYDDDNDDNGEDNDDENNHNNDDNDKNDNEMTLFLTQQPTLV